MKFNKFDTINKMLLTQFIFIITLIVNNSAICLILKKRFGELIPFVLVGFVLLFYLSGIAGSLTIGIYLYYLITIISMVCVVRLVLKNKYIFSKYILTFGFCAFVCIFVFLIIINYNRTFSLVDEWAHWAPMAEETFRLRRFHAYTDSLVWVHKIYPPFYSLLEAVYCLFVGEFKDSNCYIVLQLFSLSFFLPILESKRKIINKVIITILIILLPNIIVFTKELVYPSLFYNSIYTDWPIAFYFSFVIFYVVIHDFKERLDYILLAVLLSGLILTKQISIALVLLIVLMTTTKIFINRISIKDSLWFIFPIAMPLLFFGSWQYITNKYQIISDFSFSSIDAFALFKYFGGGLSNNVNCIFESFINAFMFRPIIIKPFSVSYFGVLIIIAVLLTIFAFHSKNNKTSVVLSSVFYFLGGIGYAYALCLSYAFSFDPSEGLTLTMYQRYMYLYVIAGLIILFLIYIEYGKDNKCYAKYIFVFTAIVLLTNIDTIKYNFRLMEYNANIKENNFDEIIKNVNREDTLLFVWQNDPEKYPYYRYKMILKQINVDEVYRIDCKSTNNQNKCTINSDELKDMFKKYDIIFVSEYDDAFTQLWRDATGIEIPYNNNFYRVNKNLGNLELTNLGG